MSTGVYCRIANRYQHAGRLTRDEVWESTVFAGYHSFECIGCAWLTHLGRPVRRKHATKINDFIKASRGQPFAHSAAVVASLTHALRNKMLYPVQDGSGVVQAPDQIVTKTQAADLLRRTGGIVRAVRRCL